MCSAPKLCACVCVRHRPAVPCAPRGPRPASRALRARRQALTQRISPPIRRSLSGSHRCAALAFLSGVSAGGAFPSVGGAVVAFVRRRRRLSRRGAPVLRPEFGPSVRADCSLMRLAVRRPCLVCLPVRSHMIEGKHRNTSWQYVMTHYSVHLSPFRDPP